VANFSVSFAVSTLIFALIFKFIPRATIAWRDVWIGSAVTALLFEVGKLLIGLYLGTTTVASGFGAAGSLVVLLLWIYFSAQIFLLGAEFTWVYAHEFGSKSAQVERKSASAVPARTDGTAATVTAKDSGLKIVR
jgi:membrane protein